MLDVKCPVCSTELVLVNSTGYDEFQCMGCNTWFLVQFSGVLIKWHKLVHTQYATQLQEETGRGN